MQHEHVNLSQRDAVHLFETSIRYRANHFHQEQEIFLVLSGDVDLIVSGKLYNLHKGDIAILGMNQIHRLTAEQKNMLLVMQFDLKLLNLWFPQLDSFQQMSAVIPHNPQSSLWQVLQRNFLLIAVNQAQKSPYAHLISLNRLLTMILALVQNMELADPSCAAFAVPTNNNQRLERLFGWINTNYQQNITLQQFASLEGVSAYYLSHDIKERLGITFTKYVTELRTSRAAQLLQSTDMSILDILIESGFSDYRYMRKAFQERFHCTPQEYREESKTWKYPHNEDENELISTDRMQFIAPIIEYYPDISSALVLD